MTPPDPLDVPLKAGVGRWTHGTSPAALADAFLAVQHWWHEATTGVPGVSLQHEQMVEFVARQMRETNSPSNGVVSDPEVLQRTIASLGVNYGISNHGDTSPHLSLDAWTDQATTQPGSLWPAWHGWLAQHSGPAAKPLTLGGMGRQRRAAMCCRPEP